MTSGKVRSLAELPQDIAPSRDLWASIESQIVPPAQAERRRRSAGWRYGLGLAAVGVWVGRFTLPGATSDTPTAQVAPEPELMRAAFEPGERFARDRAALRADLAQRLAALPPESRQKVEDSLQTIQAARADIEAALGRDPGNALLQELLVNAYQDEMRVLTTLHEAVDARGEI
jgi:hypothetical protein